MKIQYLIQHQNGRIERENRTVVEAARSMIYAKNLPQNIWAEAENTAVYAMNRTTNSKNPENTPYELWHKRKPTKLFGIESFALIPMMKRTIFDGKSEKATRYFR